MTHDRLKSITVISDPDGICDIYDGPFGHGIDDALAAVYQHHPSWTAVHIYFDSIPDPKIILRHQRG